MQQAPPVTLIPFFNGTIIEGTIAEFDVQGRMKPVCDGGHMGWNNAPEIAQRASAAVQRKSAAHGVSRGAGGTDSQPRRGERDGYNSSVRTTRPTLRITRWLRRIQTQGPGIPFQGECSACPDAKFEIPHDKRKEYRSFHQPNREVYLEWLQRGFDDHLRLVHPDEYAARYQR
jgi:hypothetical protein